MLQPDGTSSRDKMLFLTQMLILCECLMKLQAPLDRMSTLRQPDAFLAPSLKVLANFRAFLMYPQYDLAQENAALVLFNSSIEHYLVHDLTQPKAVPRFRKEKVNVLTICAALGPGDGGMLLEVGDAAIDTLQPGRLLCYHCQCHCQ